MTTVYSDAYLPGRGELSNNLRNFDRDRMLLFDEKSAFDGIVEEGLFSVFSNSYMAIIGKPLELKYARYSNDRAEEFRIRTEILKDTEGKKTVRKYPLTTEAEAHVRHMAEAYEKLKSATPEAGWMLIPAIWAKRRAPFTRNLSSYPEDLCRS